MRNGGRIGRVRLKGSDCTIYRPKSLGTYIPRAMKIMNEQEASVRILMDELTIAEPMIESIVCFVNYHDGESRIIQSEMKNIELAHAILQLSNYYYKQ